MFVLVAKIVAITDVKQLFTFLVFILFYDVQLAITFLSTFASNNGYKMKILLYPWILYPIRFRFRLGLSVRSLIRVFSFQ